MTEVGAVHLRRQRRVLLGLALLFFAPLALSFYLYYGLGWRPGGRVNHGELIEPPKPLPALALQRVSTLSAQGDGGTTSPDLLKHKWTLLYDGSGNCSASCRADLYNTRQVRTALGRDMDRVQRVFIAEDPCCDLDLLRSQHPDLIIVRATPEAEPLVALLRQSDGNKAPADRVYLIDPLGNLMMSYAFDAPPKGILEDLRRLLGLSHVG
jgi:hypothetical protein